MKLLTIFWMAITAIQNVGPIAGLFGIERWEVIIKIASQWQVESVLLMSRAMTKGLRAQCNGNNFFPKFSVKLFYLFSWSTAVSFRL